MDKDKEFLRLLLEKINSLANPEAHSNVVRRIKSEEGEENVRGKRPAESRREGKQIRVKRQCVSKSSDKSHDNLLEKEIKRERIRSKLEALKEITPNCPQSDIIAILDCAIDYMRHLQLTVLFTVLQEYVRNM